MHIGFKTRLQEISVAGQLFGSAKSRGLKSVSQLKNCTIQSGGVRLLNRLCEMFSALIANSGPPAEEELDQKSADIDIHKSLQHQFQT